jgi:hypothetical protein
MAGMRIEGKGQRRQRGQVRGWQSRRVQSRTYTEPLVPGPADNTEVVNLVNRPINPPNVLSWVAKVVVQSIQGLGQNQRIQINTTRVS